MVTDKHSQSGTAPVGLAPADGFPWTRLIGGVVAVAMSWALSSRVEQPPTEPPALHAALSAPEPAVSLDLPHLPPLPDIVPATTTVQASPPAAAAEPAALTMDTTPVAAPGHQQIQRRVANARARSAGVRHSTAQADRRDGASRVARAESNRRRAELRNEYIAAREQVAALTGEDSGSAYLAQQAARRSAAQASSGSRATGGRRPA